MASSQGCEYSADHKNLALMTTELRLVAIIFRRKPLHPLSFFANTPFKLKSIS